MKRISLCKIFVVLLLSLTGLSFTACGGSSNSGGSQVPVVLVQPGIYSGTQTFSFVFNGVADEPQMSPFELTVAGREVILAFRQFSGTSAIGANQEFAIPSGQFRIESGVPGVLCTIELLFEGRFSGDTATGTVEGPIDCPGVTGTLSLTGTFSVSRELNKQLLDAEPDFDFDLSRFF